MKDRTRTVLVSALALAFTLLAAPAHHGQGCNAGDARSNQSSPFRRGYDFVPITTDAALGFHVVYSERVPVSPGSTAEVGNTAGIYVFELAQNEILIFGSGYGNHRVATNDARHDVERVVEVVQGCLGFAPSQTLVRFAAPHGHEDHINPAFLLELQGAGFGLAEVLFHAGDTRPIGNMPGWTPALRNLGVTLWGGNPAYGYSCGHELARYDSSLGRIWFVWRGGHTNGSMDLVIDVRNNPRDRFVVMGSGSGGICSSPPPGTRQRIRAHGNVLLALQPEVVKYGCRNPEQSLRVVRGLPRPGTTVTFGVDNPVGTQDPGAVAYVALARRPDAHYPCGTTSLALGMDGYGELLLNLKRGSMLGLRRAPLPWSGPGAPAEVDISIPNDPALLGTSMYVQGLLIDSDPKVASAIELRIAP